MNQVLKDSVYGMGTMKHVEFLARLGGMNEEEYDVFLGLHRKKNDIHIQEDLGLSKKSYERIESSVRAKLLLAVFECINLAMYDEEQEQV